MKKACAYYTDVGGRANNEDCFRAEECERGILLVVADGLGGHDCGEVASALAVDEIVKRFKDIKSEFDPVKAIEAANAALLEKQRETGKRMKTTVAAAWVGNDKTCFAHVGDSRIYAFNNEAIVHQTQDHSASQMAVIIGEIAAKDIRSHSDRNILTRALGSADKLKADTFTIDNTEYDSLLLCTDGFWEYVFEEEMIKHKAADPSVWIKKMRKLIKKRAPEKNDNNTAIAFIRGETV